MRSRARRLRPRRASPLGSTTHRARPHARPESESAFDSAAAIATAAEAGLRYVNGDEPGIRRLGRPPSFRYVDPSGHRVRDAATLGRIRSLAIPPAWVDVWISPAPLGHIQATGRDARGRKQYRYHPRWREHRDAHKYSRMIEFGRALGPLRAAVERDLTLPGLPRAKVLATVVRLLELTHARVGNDEYAKSHRSYGLTTLENRHVRVRGSVIAFHYRGKSGKMRAFDVQDPRLARIVRRCEELPGQHLFEYMDGDGTVHRIGSHDVNEYMRAASGACFSAKDFRTLAGTVLAARALRACPRCTSKAQLRREIRAALEIVSGRLGTPSRCAASATCTRRSSRPTSEPRSARRAPTPTPRSARSSA